MLRYLSPLNWRPCKYFILYILICFSISEHINILFITIILFIFSTCLELGQVCKDIGLPPGILNIVTGLGSEAGAPLASHPNVDKVRLFAFLIASTCSCLCSFYHAFLELKVSLDRTLLFMYRLHLLEVLLQEVRS